MKKFLFLILLIATVCANAQTTYIQLLQDTVAHKYRFQKIEVRQYGTVADTLVTDKFPEKWLTATELKAYQEGLLAQIGERFNELVRLRKIAKDEFDTHVSYYDGIQGAGAYLALQKTQLQASIQGNWKLVERGTTTVTDNVTITALELRKNASKFGTLTIGDDLSLTLSGYFNFNLTFTLAGRGVWVTERSGKVYILKQ